MISFGTLLTLFKACLNLGAFQEFSLCNWGLEGLGFGLRVHGIGRVSCRVLVSYCVCGACPLASHGDFLGPGVVCFGSFGTKSLLGMMVSSPIVWLGSRGGGSLYLDHQKYVEQWPPALGVRVLGHDFTYFGVLKVDPVPCLHRKPLLATPNSDLQPRSCLKYAFRSSRS